MNKLLYILPVISILLLHSCIAEDLSECKFDAPDNTAKINLLFSYSDEDMPNTLFDEANIKNGTLFVFNENDSLIATRLIENPVLNENYKLNLDLDTGKYHFITWFYKYDAPYYSVTPHPASHSPAAQMKDNSRLYIRVPAESNTFFDLPHQLIFGQVQVSDSLQLTAGKPIEIPLELNYNQISFKITDIDGYNDEYQFSITDNNCIYTFENDFAGVSDFSYSVKNIRFPNNSTTLEASLNVLRLHSEHTRPVLNIIKNNSDTIYGSRLMPLLRANPAYSDTDIFQRKHRFQLELSKTEKGVIVIVDGWKIPENWEDETTLSD
jgi:hypothetical protein